VQYVGGGIGQDSATEIPYQPPVVSSGERNGLASANQGLSTASQASCHVHRILYLCLPHPHSSFCYLFSKWLHQLKCAVKSHDGFSSHQSLKSWCLLAGRAHLN